MSANSALSTYQPRFRTLSAKQTAADRWGLPDDPCPDHERMISAIRRLPGKPQTVMEARAESDAISLRFATRDPSRWRRMARDRDINPEGDAA